MTICSSCKEDKDDSLFYRDSSRPSGQAHSCKICMKKRKKLWVVANTEKHKTLKNRHYQHHKKTILSRQAEWRSKNKEGQRAYHLKRFFGITQEQYDTLLSKQKGCCGVCEGPAVSRAGKRLAVDHNHRTGEIRGLLCYGCNNKLIGRHVDPEVFEAAARYLRNSTGWFVPENRPKRRRKKRATRKRD